MPLWALHTALLAVGFALTLTLALALLWRVGSWQLSSAASLNLDEGLPIGAEAPEIAANRGRDEFHLVFGGRPSFVVFGTRFCKPCAELLRSATVHPATRAMRLVYVGNSEEVDADPENMERWEIYRFHDEARARDHWRAPVSPYFHVVDEQSRIIAKGIASKPDHLDRLLQIRPPSATHRLAPAFKEEG